MLGRIQNELFDLGADLATPGEDFAPSETALRIVASQIERLEREIDAMNEGLEPLRSFILPAGPGGVAEVHLARAIVRRAERAAVAAGRAGEAEPAGARLPEPALGPPVRARPPPRLRRTAAKCSGSRAQPANDARYYGVRGAAMATMTSPRREPSLADRYAAVRALTLDIAAPLSDADATIQPMPDASPAKWHLAHTNWFFETFLLRDHVPGYRPQDERWAYLFNSYYEGEGERHPRPKRGMLSRPSLDEIRAWRAQVDAALLEAIDTLPAGLVELGLNHEQQHQELMLMDLLATFAENPLHPAAWPAAPAEPAAPAPEGQGWTAHAGGLAEIGDAGAGFAFDSERPRHQLLVPPHALADRPVTNGEWLGFIESGGYADPRLWLADGWAWVQEQKVEAPLYWLRQDGGWHRFGLDGLRPLDPAEPACHISYYEADAFARCAGARLPTEAEWEVAASRVDPAAGHQLDLAGPARPRPSPPGPGPRDLFGNVWEWTASAFLPYPGFRPAEGTVGEYNGKFMVSQMVLRGGSCATPRGHLRASYRNFFYPHQRWMFAGLRLAKDV